LPCPTLTAGCDEAGQSTVRDSQKAVSVPSPRVAIEAVRKFPRSDLDRIQGQMILFSRFKE